MPPAERRALLLLLGLAVAGHAVRLALSSPGDAPGDVELVRSLPAQSPLAHKESTMALARPLRPGERVNLDRADAAEIARLPRVGLALAKRIVADRDSRGPFGTIEALDRVPGIGPGLLASIGGQASFEGPATVEAARSGTVELAPLPARLRSAVSLEPASAGRLSLNQASAPQLDSLPGIGPQKARAIVADRDRNGPFPSVDALSRVPGIKPALVARVRERLQAP